MYKPMRLSGVATAGILTGYRYNALGQRVAKSSMARATIHYFYDEAGRLLGEYDNAGRLIQETLYLGDLPVAVFKTAEVSENKIRPASNNIYYVYADHIRTPRVLTRPIDNKMVWRWDSSDPFGVDQPDENPSQLGIFSFNPRFPGQLFDRETKIHYNYYRNYDPQTARYIESDPIGLKGGINTYAYVDGNPLSYIDPLGLDRWGDTSANYRYTPKAGKPVDDKTEGYLTCFSACANGKADHGVTVTGGHEGGHSKGSAHETGAACDVGKNSNQSLTRSNTEQCFRQCFPAASTYGQEEADHFHMQSIPGKGGATGFPKGVR